MFDIQKMLYDGGLLAIVINLYIAVLVMVNMRLFIKPGAAPEALMEAIPPKTDREKRLSLIFGIPLLIGLFIIPVYSALQLNAAPYWVLMFHIYGIIFLTSLVDLVFIDWLLVCTITPKRIIFPGTEHLISAYKDYGFHLKVHIKAAIQQFILSAILATITLLISLKTSAH